MMRLCCGNSSRTFEVLSRNVFWRYRVSDHEVVMSRSRIEEKLSNGPPGFKRKNINHEANGLVYCQRVQQSLVSFINVISPSVRELSKQKPICSTDTLCRWCPVLPWPVGRVESR